VFDIAFSELVVIGLVALVVLGPKRLPEMARAAGRWTARIRRFIEDVKRDMGSELRREELAELRQVHQQITETKQIFENTASSMVAGIADIRPPESAPDYLVKALPDAAVQDTRAPRQAGMPRTAAASVPTPKKRASKSGRKKPANPKTKKTSTRKKHVRAGRKSKS
jgi:sec-independent protein translocase protein TatB